VGRVAARRRGDLCVKSSCSRNCKMVVFRECRRDETSVYSVVLGRRGQGALAVGVDVIMYLRSARSAVRRKSKTKFKSTICLRACVKRRMCFNSFALSHLAEGHAVGRLRKG
jgi:hypothetical protein